MRPDFQINFPTLLVSHFWAERHCVVPDSFDKGAPWEFRNWQTWCWLNFYRVKPAATVGQLAPAFHYRRSQIVLPQKAGKAPYTSAHVCNEAVGPAVFNGWAEGGEVYECAEHGCPCGWVYEYEPGEAMGVPWPTPLIQITATSEDQTGNIYDALRPMIDNGPLSVVIPKTGEEFIRLPRDGEIATVTSNAQSRLGQRVTFVPQDETGIYTKTNGMVKVAETQRRGLAGMGGRAEESTNGWDPTEDSVAQRTAKAAAISSDIFRFHPLPDKALNYRLKADRRKIHRVVYLKPRESGDEDGTPWIDLDAIEGEAAELSENDPAQAERFFGNRIVAGGGPAFELAEWNGLKRKFAVDDAATIVIGVDGARYHDALAVVACDVATGFIWPLEITEKPDNLTKDQAADYEHDRSLADGAVRDAFERYVVWRVYCDPQHIDYLMQGWKNEFGDKRIIEWATYRPRPIAYAVKDFRDAVKSGTVTHPGYENLDRHIGNAKLRELNVEDDKGNLLHTLVKEAKSSSRKMDAAMASVLAWKARGDALDAGVVWMGKDSPPPPPDEPKSSTWEPGTAPDLVAMSLAGSSSLGDLS